VFNVSKNGYPDPKKMTFVCFVIFTLGFFFTNHNKIGNIRY